MFAVTWVLPGKAGLRPGSSPPSSTRPMTPGTCGLQESEPSAPLPRVSSGLQFFSPKKVKETGFPPIVLAVGVPTSLALPRGKFELRPRSRLHSLRGFSWTLHPRHHLENVPAGQGRTRVVLPGLCQLLEQQLGPVVTSTGPRPCLASLLHRPTWPLLRRLNRRTLFCSPPDTPALSRPPPCTPCQALAGLSWGFTAFLCPPPPPTQNASSEGLCVSKLHPRVYLLANRSSVSEAPSPPPTSV